MFAHALVFICTHFCGVFSSTKQNKQNWKLNIKNCHRFLRCENFSRTFEIEQQNTDYENDHRLTIVFVLICHVHTFRIPSQRSSSSLSLGCFFSRCVIVRWCACILNKYHSFYFEIHVIFFSDECAHIQKNACFPYGWGVVLWNVHIFLCVC